MAEVKVAQLGLRSDLVAVGLVGFWTRGDGGSG